MRLTIAAAAVCFIGGISIADDVRAAVRRSTNIPAQNLGAALQTLARERDLQVVYFSAAIDTLGTQGAVGELTIDEVLGKLLSGSGLVYRYLDENTITIIPRSAAQKVEDPVQSQKRLELEEVVVTGSHIRGSSPTGTTLIVIDRDDIQQSGHSRVQDVLETLPQNFTGIGEDFSQDNVGNTTRGAEIQLRGLGPGTTLTLVNGQRQPAGGTLGAFTDISSIPASAVERIEILPDGASAIYGSDAIGGVVNIILRRDYEGGETRVRFGSVDGDADRINLGQLFGLRWDSGHALLGYEYSKTDELRWGSVDYLEANGDYRRFGGTDRRRSPGFRGAVPGTVLCPATGSFGCTPGQPAYAIPSGQNGTALTAAQLLPDQVNYFDFSRLVLLPEQETHMGYLSAMQALGERVELQFDVRAAKRDSTMVLPGGLVTTVSVPSSNPFFVNPFGGSGPVQVEYDFARDLGPMKDVGETNTIAATLGGTVRLGGDWQMQVTGAYGEESVEHDRINTLNRSAITAALTQTDRSTALNVFGDGTANNPATLATLRGSSFDDATSTTWSTGVKFDGPLSRLPAGLARLALGIDYRGEEYDLSSSFEFIGSTRREREVGAAFAELSLPLLAAHEAHPGVPRLGMSIAGRVDDYNDVGTTANPRIGIRWLPFASLELRSSWGTSFRAPPFYLSDDNIRRPGVSLATFNEGGTLINVLGISGVHPDLKEETAEVWTGGFDFTPLRNLSLSLTYFNVAYEDKIQTVGEVAEVLAFPDRFVGTGVIVRNPSQALVTELCNTSRVPANCFAAGPYSAIVDQRLRNISVVEVDGLDLNLRYALPTPVGELTFAASGTYTFHYDQGLTEASPEFEVLDNLERPLSLRLRGVVGWSLDRWRLNAALNHSGSYENRTTVPVTRIGSWTTVDLGAGYSVGSGNGWFGDLQLMLNVTNVFDEAPDFVDQLLPYDRANASLVGRVLSVQLVKGWK